jgi:trehalose 6-phosphate synthase
MRTRSPSALGSPLVVASNRGPVTFQPDEAGELEPLQGSGGLVATLADTFRREGVTWVSTAMSEGDRLVAKESKLEGPGDIRLRFVVPDDDTYDRYYGRIANGLFWLVHHLLLDEEGPVDVPSSLADDWEAFVTVNRMFAEVLDDSAPDPVFLIEDYQLPLVPRFLRELRPEARIVHFSHIPFAPPSRFGQLPVRIREEVLRGMVEADIIGFQTDAWAENFLLSLRELPDVEVDLGRRMVVSRGRTALVRVFPVAVEAGSLHAAAADPSIAEMRGQIARATGDQKLLLRVDRLDPSKNILAGFAAYELLLKDSPRWRGRVRFLALLVPSRQEVSIYRSYAEACLAEIERINAEFGTDGWTPIAARIRHDAAYALAAYGLYDVLLVDPVIDGMNLVAMEGPALNQRDGVLVLSRNAGAYERLAPHALGVDPFDIDETACAIERALEMEPAERATRALAMSRTVAAHTPAAWLADQLESLDEAVSLR